jgi:arylsulfatase A-like enzyme
MTDCRAFVKEGRCCWLRLLLILLGPFGGSAASGALKSAPNILYIFTDDQSKRTVSCYEEARPWARTPHIDRLAETGMRFTSCSTGSWCQPSRASALTGLLQHAVQSLRVTDYPMAEYDPEQLRFFPSVFRQNGYETACIGKWHLGEDVGQGRDWDYSVIWDRGGDNAWAYYEDTQVRVNGGERQPLNGYSTDRYTELAVDFIRQRKDADKPWYLWLCYSGVHGPFTPAERHQSAYAEAPTAEVPVDIFGPRPTKPEHLQHLTRWKKDENGEPKDYERVVKKYHRAVKSLDEGVGALMQALAESGQLENTVVIFTSDQGFAWGQHGFREKWQPYEANLGAPLIVSAPGVTTPGSVSTEPVTGVDIVSTIHALAGVQPEWEMHGRDLSGLLRNPHARLDEPMLMINTIHTYGDRVAENLRAGNFEVFERKGCFAWMMMREGKFKYIRHFREGVIEELYDLEADPGELTNLAASPEHRSRLVSLRNRAIEAFREKGGGFVSALPAPREFDDREAL